MGEPVERTRVRESQKEEDGEVASKSKLREREHELTAQRKLMTSEERAFSTALLAWKYFRSVRWEAWKLINLFEGSV